MKGKRKKWNLAVWSVVTLSIIFLCIKGYLNYRYQLTMLPILVTVNFLYGWHILREKGKLMKGIIYILCWLLIIAGFEKGDIKTFVKLYVLRDDWSHPTEMVNYLKNHVNLGKNDVILEVNQPFLYYYTDKKGLSYRKLSSSIYLFNEGKEKTFKIIKFKYQIRYILSDTVMEKTLSGSYRGDFFDYITKFNCDLVFEDNGKKLYKLKETLSAQRELHAVKTLKYKG
jgi:hypothetical protein